MKNFIDNHRRLVAAILAGLALFAVIGGLVSCSGNKIKTGETAYALILNNSGDSDNLYPLVFTRSDTAIEKGSTYDSTTYGKLEVLNAYTGFETDIYSAAISVPWYEHRKEITSVVTEGEITAASTAFWFYNHESCTTINLKLLNAANAESMQKMFYSCSALTSLTLSEQFGQNATHMGNMFDKCTSLTSIALPEGFGQNVITANNVFYTCSALTSLTLPEGFAQKAEDVSYMFYKCSSLTSLNISNGFGKLATDVGSIFYKCEGLTELSLPSGFGQSATDMSHMFYKCSALTTLTFPEDWSTANVTDMSCMFYKCPTVVVNCSDWNIEKVVEHSSFNHEAYHVVAPEWEAK